MESNNNSSKEDFRSGFVSIVGRPNVGKSTFLNTLLGQKVSIVTSKPQTTRNRIIGIKDFQGGQVAFVDTPGIHRPKHGLGAIMVKKAREALRDMDAILFMVEPAPPEAGDQSIIRMIEKAAGKGHAQAERTPVLLLINKIDKVKKHALLPLIEAYSGLYAFSDIIPVSSTKGDGLDIVLERVKGLLPQGPRYYPEGLLTDQAERFMVAEIIREKAMKATGEDVPHSVAVEITSWKERHSGAIYIGANIYVEKNSQKGIIIGKQGARLKAIGTSARADIQGLLKASVFLELLVKVRKHWRKDTAALRELELK